jgi:hypothetical protein
VNRCFVHNGANNKPPIKPNSSVTTNTNNAARSHILSMNIAIRSAIRLPSSSSTPVHIALFF